MQPFIQLQPTPPDKPLNDAPATTTTTPQDEFIHNFSNIEWHEDEPTPSHKPQMLHLLTITGLLTIAQYNHTHTWGEHFIAWAPLSATPLQLH